ncbi:hypothetical protein H0H93_009478 [Arthromyces matolae]|nr:hypothetical protein H0H93_009478 [Arthromyces matolae]
MYQISLKITHNPDEPFLKRRDESAFVDVFVYVDMPSNWAIDVAPIVTDAVVVWRAWIICRGNRRRGVLWFLAMLWFSAAAVILIATIMQSIPYIEANVLEHDVGLSAFLYAGSIALSIATNFLATSLIGWKLWYARGTPKLSAKESKK